MRISTQIQIPDILEPDLHGVPTHRREVHHFKEEREIFCINPFPDSPRS